LEGADVLERRLRRHQDERSAREHAERAEDDFLVADMSARRVREGFETETRVVLRGVAHVLFYLLARILELGLGRIEIELDDDRLRAAVFALARERRLLRRRTRERADPEPPGDVRGGRRPERARVLRARRRGRRRRGGSSLRRRRVRGRGPLVFAAGAEHQDQDGRGPRRAEPCREPSRAHTPNPLRRTALRQRALSRARELTKG